MANKFLWNNSQKLLKLFPGFVNIPCPSDVRTFPLSDGQILQQGLSLPWSLPDAAAENSVHLVTSVHF